MPDTAPGGRYSSSGWSRSRARSAIFVSLLASCGLHGIEPWANLRDLLCLLPSWPKSRVLDLAPVVSIDGEARRHHA